MDFSPHHIIAWKRGTIYTVREGFTIAEFDVLSEELAILDGNSASWIAARPLLDAALRLEQQDAEYVWHGWNREQICLFLKKLPAQCSIVVGVWEIVTGTPKGEEREHLTLGLVCEVVDGEIRSVRTFESLATRGLKPVEELEPAIEDALEIMRVVRRQVAPVAWALFIDKITWDSWLFADGTAGEVIDKGELLASFARQGRCVLLGGGGEPRMHDVHHFG